jgi:DnaJ homolog subfamily A member 5
MSDYPTRLQREMLKEHQELDLEGNDSDDQEVDDGELEETIDSKEKEEPLETPPPKEDDVNASEPEEPTEEPVQKKRKKKQAKPSGPEIVKQSKAELRAQQREAALHSSMAPTPEDLDSGQSTPSKKGKQKKKGGVGKSALGTGVSTPVSLEPNTDPVTASPMGGEESLAGEVEELDIAADETAAGTEDATSTEPLSKREKRRAKEAAKKEQATTPTSTSKLVRILLKSFSPDTVRPILSLTNGKQVCNVCQSEFDSRTRLFEHIRKTGHARATDVDQEAQDRPKKGGGKRR